MELLHWGPLAQVITKGGTTVNQEIMPAYAAYQKAIDLTLYHAFAELVVQTSQDDKARMHYRQIEAAQIWQQDVDVSIYFEQYSPVSYTHLLDSSRWFLRQITGVANHAGCATEGQR